MDDVQQNVTLVFKVTSVCLDAPSVNNFDRLLKAGSEDVVTLRASCGFVQSRF